MRDVARCPMTMVVLAATLMLAATGIHAQESGARDEVYRIGAGDVLRLNVPQLPSLDGELNVQADGSVYVAQVGEVDLGGLTLEEAEELLVQRVRLISPGVSDIVLGVVEYNALRIFVLGALQAPGSFTFEAPPTLWEVLRAAGGPAENANLAACRVITMVGGRPASRTVNMTGYLTGDHFPQEVLQGGDTLVVPTVAEGIVGVSSTEGVQVFGGVATPTTVPLDRPTELLTVLMLAGAPIETAELNKIDWVHRGTRAPGEALATRVDMRLFLEEGLPAGNPIVHPGDVVYLPQRRDSWFQRNMPLFMAVLTTATTIVLAYDRIQE